MSSMPKILTQSLKTTKRRAPATTKRSRRLYRNLRRAHRKSLNNGGGRHYSSKICDKLQYLKNLIPAQNNNGELKAERLFQDTADYIVLLRTQVVILQRLIQFHGSGEMEEEPALL